MKQRRKIYVVCLAVLAALFLGGAAVSAETETVKMTGIYGQTEARSMLAMINDFRTGPDAWYWNETNSEKINETGLRPLAYDYQLEQVAMLRAMEIAVHFAHERPNGTGYAWSLLESGYGGWNAFAENIAAGQTTAAEAFESWQETNRNYAGQGHRRNMLSSKVTAVGIGHVYYNGWHYWVQEFRAPSGSLGETPANDSETSVEIEVDSSVITGREAKASLNSIELPYKSSVRLPEITGGIRTYETWPGGICPIDLSYEWESADTAENYIKLDREKGTIEAVGLGTTEITAVVTETGTEIRVPVTVVEIPIDSAENSAQITLNPASYTYSGEACSPGLTVTLDGTELTAETDYTVEYENNVNAGTAAVTITGTGNYKGRLTKEFEIAAKELGSESSVTFEEDTQVYTGSEIRPKATVACREKELTPGTDYEIIYRNNTDAGEAFAVIAAKGNYTGELTGTFTILPLDLEEGNCSIDKINPQEYTGLPVVPEITVRHGKKVLKEAVDYSVQYSGNKAPGTAAVTITGQGNYTGTMTQKFVIQEAPKETEKPSAKPVFKKGSSKKDPATGTIYKVTGSDSTGQPTVEYTAPGNKGKASVTIPATVLLDNVKCKVTSVANNAFKNNKKIKKIVIGKNVSVIGSNAFRGCVKLSSVTLGAGVVTIKAGAFFGCTALKELTIPAKVTRIGKQALYGCKKLARIVIRTQKLTSKSIGQNAFGKLYAKVTVKVPKSKLKDYKKLLRAGGIGAKSRIS